jgi:eukaryotic-like serine/threonine-protein kinase
MTVSLTNAVIGEYRIVDKLGEGGMGEVYRAVHNKIGRVAAVKVMTSSPANRDFVDRFLNEARIQARLHHPNIATLYDFLEFEGRPCIIMEYVEGQTLSELIRSRGALPRHEALPIFGAIVDALSYVHSQGVIHRDIKSTNVKITPVGEVKLLDFGIAKSGTSPSLTVTGGFVGTLQYISPERFRGDPADARCDVWALGVLLYEIFTGQLPFDANSVGGLYEQIKAGAYSPPSALNAYIPREVEVMIGRCLKRNPAERYQSARDLSPDLRRLGMFADQQPDPPFQIAPSAVKAREQAASPVREAMRELTNASKPAVKWPLIASAAVALLMMLVGGFYLIGRILDSGADSPATTPSTQQSVKQPTATTRSDPDGSQSRLFTLEVSEGQADVYKDGAKIGVTPYKFPANPGEDVSVVLKREGFSDKPVKLSVSENKRIYTFSMSRKE